MKFLYQYAKVLAAHFWNDDEYEDYRIGSYAAIAWYLVAFTITGLPMLPWYVILAVGVLVFLVVAGMMKLCVKHPAWFIMIFLIMAMVFTYISVFLKHVT